MESEKRDALSSKLQTELLDATRACDDFLTALASTPGVAPASPPLLTDERVEAFRDACTHSNSVDELIAALRKNVLTDSLPLAWSDVSMPQSPCVVVSRPPLVAKPDAAAAHDTAAVMNVMRTHWFASRYELDDDASMRRLASAACKYAAAARLSDMPQQLSYCLTLDPTGKRMYLIASELCAPLSLVCRLRRHCRRAHDTANLSRTLRSADGSSVTLVARACLQLLVRSSTSLTCLDPVFTFHIESVPRVADSTSVAESHAPPIYAPAAASTLLAMGDSNLGCLGLQAAVSTQVPCIVPSPRVLGRWVIRQVAACATHCAAVTQQGSLFTWGSGSSGALGLRGTESFAQPQLVEFFGLLHPLRVTCVAVGADADCSHTAVVADGYLDDETTDGGTAVPADVIGRGIGVADTGRVFIMGGGPATCQAAADAIVSMPRLVHAPRGDMYDPSHGGVAQVAAGGGFSIARTASGALFAWGRYEDGRLGIGVLQPLLQPRSRSAPAPKAVLQPTRITSGIIATTGVPAGSKTRTVRMRHVACGTKHAVAVDDAGVAWTWGAHPGAARPAFEPQRMSIVSDPVTFASASERCTLLVTAAGDATIVQPEVAIASMKRSGYGVNDSFVTGALTDTHAMLVSAQGHVYTRALDGSTPLTLFSAPDGMSLAAHECTSVACSGTVTLICSAGLRVARPLMEWLPPALQGMSASASLAAMQLMMQQACRAKVVVEGRVISVHAAIVAAAAPALRWQLAADMSAQSFSTVELFDVSLAAALAFLMWCYGAVDMRLAGVDDATVVELNSLAARLNMPALQDLCTEHLMCPARMWRDALERGDEPALPADAALDATDSLVPAHDMITQGFAQLHAEDMLHDMRIKCWNGTADVHACMLRAHSPEIAAMLVHRLGHPPTIIDLECPKATVDRMLEFVYSGKIASVDTSTADGARAAFDDLHLAQHLQMNVWQAVLESCIRLPEPAPLAATGGASSVTPAAVLASLCDLMEHTAFLGSSSILHRRCQRSLMQLLRDTSIHQQDTRLALSMLKRSPDVCERELNQTCSFPCACSPGTPCRWITAAAARAAVREAALGQENAAESRTATAGGAAQGWRDRAWTLVRRVFPLHVVLLIVVCISAVLALHGFGWANTPAVPALNICVAVVIVVLMFVSSPDDERTDDADSNVRP